MISIVLVFFFLGGTPSGGGRDPVHFLRMLRLLIPIIFWDHTTSAIELKRRIATVVDNVDPSSQQKAPGRASKEQSRPPSPKSSPANFYKAVPPETKLEDQSTRRSGGTDVLVLPGDEQDESPTTADVVEEQTDLDTSSTTEETPAESSTGAGEKYTKISSERTIPTVGVQLGAAPNSDCTSVKFVAAPDAPVAKEEPRLVSFGPQEAGGGGAGGGGAGGGGGLLSRPRQLVDSYGWLADRQNPDVQKLLQDENAYADRMSSAEKVDGFFG